MAFGDNLIGKEMYIAMAIVNKIMQSILSGTQDRNIKFIVEVPELPGCMADGATAVEALENVEVVISEWIETAKELGREIPEPKGKLMYA